MKTLKNIDKDWTLFLDRDGVINVRPVNNYVKNIAEFIFIEGVPEAIKTLNNIFKYTFIVTNQGGINKELMTEQNLAEIHGFMTEQLIKNSAKVDDIFFCPFRAEENHFLRKPNPGMALQAKKKYPDIQFKKSVMVGDSMSDMMFGKKLKMLTVFISPDIKEARQYPRLIDYSFKTLSEFQNTLVDSLYPGHN